MRSLLLLGALAACADVAGAPGDAAVSADAGTPDASSARLRVAYARRDDLTYDLVLADLKGAPLEVLTSSGSSEVSPAWSPDGRLAFATDRTGQWTIRVRDLARDEEISIGRPDLAATEPAFSPDGRWIAFQGIGADRDLFVASSTGGPSLRALTSGPAQDGDPAWAPDGETIYFVSNRAGAFELFSIPREGGDVRQLTTGSHILGRPAVAGSRVAYTSSALAKPAIVSRDLLSGQETTLTQEGDSEPALSPDGRYLAFTSTRFGGPEIMLLDLGSGSAPVRLTEDELVEGAPAIGIEPSD